MMKNKKKKELSAGASLSSSFALWRDAKEE